MEKIPISKRSGIIRFTLKGSSSPVAEPSAGSHANRPFTSLWGQISAGLKSHDLVSGWRVAANTRERKEGGVGVRKHFQKKFCLYLTAFTVGSIAHPCSESLCLEGALWVFRAAPSAPSLSSFMPWSQQTPISI